MGYYINPSMRFPFTYQTNLYFGKPVAGNWPYYLTATEEYIKTLVEAMPVNNMKGQNISMDRLYTSVSTAKWLLPRNITLVGTLQLNRIGLSDELKNPKERSELESTIERSSIPTLFSVHTQPKQNQKE